MKAKLIKKTDGWYNLYDGEIGIGSTHEELQGYKLSKQNCDEIFVVVDVDVEKLAEEYGSKFAHSYNPEDFIAGFNKAMELNKGKVFTLNDLETVWHRSADYRHNPIHENSFGECIKSLQQPTEIEVEIETTMRPVWGDESSMRATYVTKLDSEGCLILKKI
jgi:hypothetical protein